MIGADRLQALELSRNKAATPKELERVALATSAETARWAFLQWELRSRARAKFSRADEMLFTREALEQATHETVSKYHATCFPQGSMVLDLTCSIGSDLIALTRRGPTMGFELDPERAEIAQFNLQALGLSAAVLERDCLASEWPAEYAFADPARRIGGRRTLKLDEFSPDPSVLSERMAHLKLGGIKLSPLLKDEELALLGRRIEFVSFAGECREALVWTGQEAIPGVCAVQVDQHGGAHTLASRAADPPRPKLTSPREYFYEADPSAIRAHALDALAAEHDLVAVGDSNGYLSGSEFVSSPWLRSYRVLYDGAGDPKRTQAALRELGADVPILKQRGVGADLDKLKRLFKQNGSRKLCLALWKNGGSVRHTILEPLVH